MSGVERGAAEDVVYKRHFEAAFHILDKTGGQTWLSPAEVSPVAALQDDVFMTRRRLINNLKFVLSFGRRQPEDIPLPQEYPPDRPALLILNMLVEDGVIERTEPEAIARGLVTHPTYLAPVYDGYLYRLAPERQTLEP